MSAGRAAGTLTNLVNQIELGAARALRHDRLQLGDADGTQIGKTPTWSRQTRG